LNCYKEIKQHSLKSKTYLLIFVFNIGTLIYGVYGHLYFLSLINSQDTFEMTVNMDSASSTDSEPNQDNPNIYDLLEKEPKFSDNYRNRQIYEWSIKVLNTQYSKLISEYLNSLTAPPPDFC
jgi:hypothetical protein